MNNDIYSILDDIQKYGLDIIKDKWDNPSDN